MRISLVALINILRRNSGDIPLTIENCNNPKLLWIKQFCEGEINRLTYDFEQQTVFGISEGWMDLLASVVDTCIQKKTSIIEPEKLSEEDWHHMLTEENEDEQGQPVGCGTTTMYPESEDGAISRASLL